MESSPSSRDNNPTLNPEQPSTPEEVNAINTALESFEKTFGPKPVNEVTSPSVALEKEEVPYGDSPSFARQAVASALGKKTLEEFNVQDAKREEQTRKDQDVGIQEVLRKVAEREAKAKIAEEEKIRMEQIQNPSAPVPTVESLLSKERTAPVFSPAPETSSSAVPPQIGKNVLRPGRSIAESLGTRFKRLRERFLASIGSMGADTQILPESQLSSEETPDNLPKTGVHFTKRGRNRVPTSNPQFLDTDFQPTEPFQDTAPLHGDSAFSPTQPMTYSKERGDTDPDFMPPVPSSSEIPMLNTAIPTLHDVVENPATSREIEISALEQRLDADLKKRGFSTFIKRIKAFGEKNLDKASKLTKQVTDFSLNWRELPNEHKAMWACSTIALASTATALGAGMPAVVAVGALVKGIAGIGTYAAYTKNILNKKKEAGSTESLTLKEISKGLGLAFGISVIVPKMAQEVFEAIDLEKIVTTAKNLFETSPVLAPVNQDAVIPVPESPLATAQAAQTTPSTPGQSIDRTLPDVTHATPTFHPILIGRGDTVSSLIGRLVNKDDFPELEGITERQKENLIQNVIKCIEKDPAAFGLDKKLWLTEGKTFDHLQEIYETIRDGKINGIPLIERALSIKD